jgi:uncharacterized protein YkwD
MTENRRILSVVAVLFACIALPTAASADLKLPPPSASVPTVPTVPSLAPTNHELAILRTINSVRRAHGARPLGLGPALHRAARAHSVDMARRGYFDHGPFVQRLRRFGVRSRVIGENLAYATEPGFSAGVVVRMWLASPSHRSVLLDRSFSRIGIGVAGGTTRLVTADFAG